MGSQNAMATPTTSYIRQSVTMATEADRLITLIRLAETDIWR